MPSINFPNLQCHVDLAGVFKPGDPPPTGYLDWTEWADVQHKAGLRQVRCGRCGLCKYPQELSAQVDVSHPARGDTGQQVRVETPVCLKCAK